jgi:hypothetical protein
MMLPITWLNITQMPMAIISRLIHTLYVDFAFFFLKTIVVNLHFQELELHHYAHPDDAAGHVEPHYEEADNNDDDGYQELTLTDSAHYNSSSIGTTNSNAYGAPPIVGE